MNSRYIIELSGTLSISSTNNSVINIPDVAGSNSNVAIDLSILGTVGGGGGCNILGIEYGANSVINSEFLCCSGAAWLLLGQYGISNTCSYIANKCEITTPNSCSTLNFAGVFQ